MIDSAEYIVLGAGVSGLSCSYHLGHQNCIILEAAQNIGGLTRSIVVDGVRWEQGPHVSFTNNSFVKEVLSANLAVECVEIQPKMMNYFSGDWIPHPAQFNLYALSHDIRNAVIEGFKSRVIKNTPPENYEQWLEQSFGSSFTNMFSSAYTKKYWTVEPKKLAIDWIGVRIAAPSLDEVISGAKRRPRDVRHYVTEVRYPKSGGFQEYFRFLRTDANILFGTRPRTIDLDKKLIYLNNREKPYSYKTLISTIPLPEFIKLCNPPEAVLSSAEKLACTSAILVNVVSKTASKDAHFHWCYVYDSDKLSTRISRSDLLSNDNAPVGVSGIQVEVYYSKLKPLIHSPDQVGKIVVNELIEMGVIKSYESVNVQKLEWANVLFDLERRKHQDVLLSWLESYGLVREYDDLEPITNWELKFKSLDEFGSLILAGRFSQWKYYWTDDCFLRAKLIGENVAGINK